MAVSDYNHMDHKLHFEHLLYVFQFNFYDTESKNPNDAFKVFVKPYCTVERGNMS